VASNADEVFIFDGDEIRPLPARPFRAGLFGKSLENALHTLIEKQPNVINGRQLDPGSDDPPRFVLLRREAIVGDWSLDHLLVDQRGVPTLVEAKLLQNPESRRAVVGQIMEYAANAERSWSDGRLRQLASEYWRKAGKDIDEVLRAAFGDIDVEAFWGQVEANLKQGRLRLIIAADDLRPEVRRIIEFLNQQLRTVQVYGLEIRCFTTDSGSGVIVPFLVGQTQAAADEKGRARPLVTWTLDELRRVYVADGGSGQRAARLLDWAVQHGCAQPGKSQTPLFYLRGSSGDRIATVYQNALYVVLRASNYPDGVSDRDQLVRDLKAIGLYPEDLDPASVVDGRNISRGLSDLTDDAFDRLLGILSRYCGKAD
jgi:hypothetical protein